MPLSEAEANLKHPSVATPSRKVISSQHPRQQSRTLATRLNDAPQSHSVSRPHSQSTPKVTNAAYPPSRLQYSSWAANFEADTNTLQQLAISCQKLAPLTGIETRPHPDCVFLDITNLAPLYGSESQLLQQAIEHFKQAGYLVQAAIADTIGIAWGLAHYAQEDPVIAAPGSQLKPLQSLPIQSLRLSETTCETLLQLGIHQVQQLLQLPRSSLTSRFGDEVNVQLDRACGSVPEVFQAIHPPPEYSAEKLLEWPVKDAPTTLVIIERLLEEVCQQLISDACGALQWHIHLTRQQTIPLQLSIKLFQPTTTASHVMQLVEMQLDNHPELKSLSSQKRKHLGKQSPIVAVRVSVTHQVQLAERQHQLFDEEASLNRNALAQLINRLSSRLGQDQVTRPVLQSSAQPEFSFRFKPLVDPGKTSRTKQKKSHYVMARPLRLLNPAIELIPHPRSRKLPDQFQRPNRSTLPVHRHWGPERIETGWWRGQTVCRDYWRIETDCQAQVWVYRDRRSGKWYLHGEF